MFNFQVQLVFDSNPFAFDMITSQKKIFLAFIPNSSIFQYSTVSSIMHSTLRKNTQRLACLPVAPIVLRNAERPTFEKLLSVGRLLLHLIDMYVADLYLNKNERKPL